MAITVDKVTESYECFACWACVPVIQSGKLRGRFIDHRDDARSKPCWGSLKFPLELDPEETSE